MRLLGKILYGSFITMLVLVAGLLLVTLLPITGNVEVKIVKSGSMEPNIPVGAVVVVMPATFYNVGDVITFGKDTAREIPTTHRIVAKRVEGNETYFTTKGDANEEADPRETALSEVIGKVYLNVPYVGYVLDFARQPLGFALLIGVPAAMIIIDESVTIVKEIAALRRRRNEDVEEEEDYEEPGYTYAYDARYMPVPQKPHYFEDRERIPTI